MPQFILSNANRRRWMLALALCFSLTATAQGLPRAKNPEEVGLSSERLKRLSETFKGEIGKGIMPGAVLLIARRGKVAHYEALGVRDPQTSDAMPVDAIFRLASMTKPMVSMAIMMLVEEGRMALTDPLSRYLPEFKNLQVGVEQKDASGETRLVLEPMRREMTIQDLLRHTAGLTYGQFGEKTLVKRSTIRPRCRALNSLRRSTSRGWRSCRWRINPVRRGITAWPPMCSAVCSKWCTDKTSTPCCASASPGRSPCVIPASRRRPPAMHVSPSLLSTKKPAGAFTDATLPNRRNALAAVVASAADYVRFCQMLLNGGELDGVRLLSKSTVALMTANHLPADIRYIIPSSLHGPVTPSPAVGQGWGLGFVGCAPTWARTRCTVRSANIIGTARPARRSG